MLQVYRLPSTPSSPASAGTDSPPSWCWVSLTGPDSQDFLHRVTSIDVRSLTPGVGARGFFLTPQGKIRVYFTLWCLAAGEYGIELDAGREGRWQTELHTAIEQYTFSEKMTSAPVSGITCAWLFVNGSESVTPGQSTPRTAEGAPQLALAMQKLGAPTGSFMPFQTFLLDGKVRACHYGERDFGHNWITLWGRTADLDDLLGKKLGHMESIGLEQVEIWRVQSLRPRVDYEITDAAMPLELGLSDGLAKNKGCYPGQEVIEKVVSIGEPARRLVRIEGTLPAPRRGAGVRAVDEVRAEGGHITSVVREGDHYWALAVVRKTQARIGSEVRFPEDDSSGRIVAIAP